MNKTVKLEVDGQTETVRTFGSSVDDVLKAKGIKLTGDDKVSPARGHKLADDENIIVKYARPVTLSVDGKSEERVVYGATVKEVLGRFGIKPHSGAYLSHKRSAKIPRKGMDLVVSNPKKLEVVADGDTKKVTTAAPTVGAVLAESGVKLDADDEVKPAKKDLVPEGVEVKVVRIKTETKTEEVDVKFPVEATDDPSMAKGKTEIISAGKLGKKREKVKLVDADGKRRDRIVLKSTVLTEPVKQVEKRGTQEAPSVADGSAWDKIAKCESGGNWATNTGNGYYGGLQFSAPTWHSVGGAGLPSDHTREEQIKRAVILQKRSGWGQWGCADARFS